MTPWTITLFQELTLCRDGRVVQRFRSQKAAALLAYLACHVGQAHAREFLCELLWPDEDPLVARNRFRVTLASLRRQLEPPGVPPGSVLESVGNSAIRLRAEAVSTDVAVFERAVKTGDIAGARAVYRGPLLPFLYDEWVLGEQERFAAQWEALQAATPAKDTPAAPAAAPPRDGMQSPAPLSTAFLPTYLTRFVGRETERAQIHAWLADPAVRLVTLTGPGGNGKTRLATEAARDAPTFSVFVPLADLWEAGRLCAVLCRALDVTPQNNEDATLCLMRYCHAPERQNRRLCFFLDNLEQIAQGIAPILADLLARIPALTFLVTSRRRLDLPGERELTVAALPLPSSDDLELVSRAASVEVFVDRAQSVRPDFALTPRNRESVAALCRLLDGSPLALELAAARVGVLTPEQILSHFRTHHTLPDDNSPIVRKRGAKEERHRSLYAVMEWSFALLPPDLRRVLLALSLFRGGWDADSAAAVTGEAHLLDSLSRLRGHSLVTPEGTRFRLLETVRAWAYDRLTGDEANALAARHAAHFVVRGEAAIAQTGGPQETAQLDALQTDEANLRAAWAWILHDRDTISALRLGLVFYALGRVRGSLTETMALLERALSLPPADGDTPLRARTLVSLGSLAQSARGPETAQPFLERALPLARKSGDEKLLARVLRSLADNALLQEQYAPALPLFEEALALQTTLGDQRGASQTKNSLSLLALRHTGDTALAHRYMQEAADHYRQSGDKRLLAEILFNQGELAREEADLPGAERFHTESLQSTEETGDQWQRAYCLIALAEIAHLQNKPDAQRSFVQEALPLALALGDFPTLALALRLRAELASHDKDARLATTLLAAASALQKKHPAAQEPDDIVRFEAAVSHARAALHERTFRSVWEKGTLLAPEKAVEYALAVIPLIPG